MESYQKQKKVLMAGQTARDVDDKNISTVA